MIRLKPTEIQIQPIEVIATRRNHDARRHIVNTRTRAMMHRTFHDTSQDTVILKPRSGPGRSRDQSLSESVTFFDHAQTAMLGQASDEDDGVNDLFDSSLLLSSNPGCNRRIVLPLVETDKAGGHGKFSPTDSGHSSPITDMARADALLPFSLPFRPRPRQRSSSDPLSSLQQGSSSYNEELAEDDRHAARARISQPQLLAVEARQSDTSPAFSELVDQSEAGSRTPSPSAILEAVGGLVSPLDALQSGIPSYNSTDTIEAELEAPNHLSQQHDSERHSDSIFYPRQRSNSQIQSSLPTLSRQNAVRLTPARRRQHARTAYTERHLQPNFAALRAERPSSEGSPAPRSVRQMPWTNQENMGEGERLVEARRVWLARGRTAGVLDQTPPQEGRFERYL